MRSPLARLRRKLVPSKVAMGHSADRTVTSPLWDAVPFRPLLLVLI